MMCQTHRPVHVVLLALTGLLMACEGDQSMMTGAADGGVTPTPTAPGAPRCPAAAQVTCVDQMIGQLQLKSVVNPAMVLNQDRGNGVFESLLDARAGGMSPNTSFIYVRFTPQGLEKLALDDEDGFESMDWDLAFRRYVIRVNGGVSGPSCVRAAESGLTFDQLNAVPATLAWKQDVYLDPKDCSTIVAMSLLGGPLTALDKYYNYKSCLTMSGQAFVIQLRDGRHVALEVLAYYPPAVQDTCNRTGTLPAASASGSGQFQVRWKFLP